jgi:hypothetical protein
MSYEPSVVAAADYGIARRPSFGGEMKVYLSSDEAVEIGEISMTATNSGTYEGDTVNEAVLAANPSDLVLVVSPEVKSDTPIVVTVTGTDQFDVSRTFVGTIIPPAWVPNQTYDFPEGYAVDLVPSVVGKKVKTITDVSVSGGDRGSKMKIVKLPSLDTFTIVGCTTDKEFTTKTRPPKPIACGLDGSEHVKFGRSEPGSLNVTQKYVSYADGLGRFAGRRCTAMAVVEKEEAVITERHFFGNFVPKVMPKMPDGDGEATMGGEGLYEQYAFFVAK